MSDINHQDCMNHSISKNGCWTDSLSYTSYNCCNHSSSSTTSSMSSFATCGGIETLPCILFKTDSLEKYAWIWFLTAATLLLKITVCCLYFEHFSCQWQMAQDRLCISTLLRHQILLLNIPSHERSTLFHQFLAFEAPIPQ